METVVAIKIVPLRIDPLGNTNERFNTGAEREREEILRGYLSPN
jgi:hypothetical protein